MADFTDEQLVSHYLSGDEKSLEILIARHLDEIYRFTCKFVRDEAEAEDVCQETFVKAWKKIKKFDADRKFKPWLYAIAKNTALDHLRAVRAAPFSAMVLSEGDDSFSESIIDTASRPDERFAAIESDNWLKNAVAKLSDKYRRVVIMRHNGYTFRQIAEQLGEPLHTVKSRYRRALAILRKVIS